MAQQVDDFAKLMIERVTDTINDYNGKIEQIKSVDSIEQFQEHYLANDPSLAQFNAEIERLESALESIKSKRLVQATPNIKAAYDEAVKDTGVDMTALDEQLKMIRGVVKVLKDNYVEDAVKDLPEIAKRKGANTGAATGTGPRRIRGFNVYVDGVMATIKHPKTKLPVSTFSAASNANGWDNTELTDAFLAAAGSDKWNEAGFPTMVDFEFAGKQIKVIKQGDSDEEPDEDDSAA